jgi:hypothetical protein
MDTFTIRDAADQCGVSYETMRKRVDRGSVRSVKQDGVRLVPRAELDRTGLWPGSQPETVSGTELEQLRTALTIARQELETLRAVPKQLTAEREARGRLEAELFERQAIAAAAEERAAEAVAAADELRGLEAELRAAGPIRAWKLARTRRRAAEAA